MPVLLYRALHRRRGCWRPANSLSWLTTFAHAGCAGERSQESRAKTQGPKTIAPDCLSHGHFQSGSRPSTLDSRLPAMHDPRIDRLADILLDHSCRAEAGRARAHRGVRSAGRRRWSAGWSKARPSAACVPLVSWKSNAVLRSLYQTATEESMKLAGQFESARMEQVQAYIGIRGAANSSQFADVPHERRWTSTRSIGGRRCIPTCGSPRRSGSCCAIRPTRSPRRPT